MWINSAYGFKFGLLWNFITKCDFITKWGSYFITKCDKGLLQNASGVLLQNVTALLHNATVITLILLQNAKVVTKRDFNHKMRRYKLPWVSSLVCKMSFIRGWKCFCLHVPFILAWVHPGITTGKQTMLLFFLSFPLYIRLLFPEAIIIVESKSRIYSKRKLVTSFVFLTKMFKLPVILYVFCENC